MMNDELKNDQWMLVADRRPPISRFVLMGKKRSTALLEVQAYDGSINKANRNKRRPKHDGNSRKPAKSDAAN
jgi:hypothetical protein